MLKQVIVIGGGNYYHNYEDYLLNLKTREVTIDCFIPHSDWKTNLQKDLGNKYQVLLPRMPNRDNARFNEWKMWFERMFPFVKNNIIIIGHSLGGIFLARYLSEYIFPKKINKLILVSAPYKDSEATSSGFILPQSLTKLSLQCKDIHIFHSINDPLVPFSHANKYVKSLPHAILHQLNNRGHINQASFPELLSLISM